MFYLIEIVYKLQDRITLWYIIRISNGWIRWDRMNEYSTVKPTGSPSELVTIYGEINCPTESNNANRYLTINAPRWVNLTNSKQFYFHVVFLELLKYYLFDCLTVCWLLDWTASQLVEILYIYLRIYIYKPLNSHMLILLSEYFTVKWNRCCCIV